MSTDTSMKIQVVEPIQYGNRLMAMCPVCGYLQEVEHKTLHDCESPSCSKQFRVK